MAPYVIALLGADGGDFVHRMRADVRAALDVRVTQLGLEPGVDVLVVDETSYPADLDGDVPVAGVYFGAPTQSDKSVAAAQDLVARGAYVLPVVPDVMHFTSHVPAVLGPINGDAPEPGGELAQRVASRIAEHLGLLRRRRLAFISYKRAESTGVANQLHDALEARGFEVFLDTYSVEKGVEFQPVLWDRMADADLLVLLDTKTAFKSRWVEEEVSRATMMGLAVLQLVWPGHTRTPGTDACDAVDPDAGDFEAPGPDDAAGRLRAPFLARLVSQAEDLRARAFAVRRMRLVGEVQRLASANRLGVAVRTDRARCDLCARRARAALASRGASRCGATAHGPRGRRDGGSGGGGAGLVRPRWDARGEGRAPALAQRVPPPQGPAAGRGWRMSEHVVEARELAPVFLSGSVPDPLRDAAYFQTARPARIREAVTQLARVVLPHGLLVFGGHPAFSPLVLTVAQQLGAVGRVVIYQSEFFASKVPQDSMAFPNLKWTPEVGGDRGERSLERMREEMLGAYGFGAGFFVGGMHGIEDEFAMFARLRAGVPAYPVASTGGAARMLFDRGEGPQDAAVRGMLERELVYGYLFQKLLGLAP